MAVPCAGQHPCAPELVGIHLQVVEYTLHVGRHKARPLQLIRVWCGRSNERTYRLGADYGCALIVHLMRTLERASLQVGCVVGARPAQGTATTTDEGLVRTLERASLRVGCVVGVGDGARPAQGAATTTDEGLVRTLERASLRLGCIPK